MSANQKNLIENDSYEPPTELDWIRLTLGYGDCFDGELGQGGISLESGIAFIDIFVVKDKGDTAGNIYAESLRSLFRSQSISYVEGSTTYRVYCQLVDIEPLGVDENYSHTQVRVKFENVVH